MKEKSIGVSWCFLLNSTVTKAWPIKRSSRVQGYNVWVFRIGPNCRTRFIYLHCTLLDDLSIVSVRVKSTALPPWLVAQSCGLTFFSRSLGYHLVHHEWMTFSLQ